MKERYLSVELPDTTAKIDFLGKFGCAIKLTLVKNELHVLIMANDDQNLVIEDKCYEIPKADTRR